MALAHVLEPLPDGWIADWPHGARDVADEAREARATAGRIGHGNGLDQALRIGMARLMK